MFDAVHFLVVSLFVFDFSPKSLDAGVGVNGRSDDLTFDGSYRESIIKSDVRMRSYRSICRNISKVFLRRTHFASSFASFGMEKYAPTL